MSSYRRVYGQLFPNAYNDVSLGGEGNGAFHFLVHLCMLSCLLLLLKETACIIRIKPLLLGGTNRKPKPAPLLCIH